MKKILLSILPLLIVFMLIGLSSAGIAKTTDDDLQDALNQARESRQALKDARAEEASEKKQEGQAKGQANREAAQARKEAARQKMEDKRKETLLRLVDVQIKQFERVKERVQKMPRITDELKSELATEIDAAIQNLNNQKAKVQGVEGRESIQALAKEIRNLFKAKHEIVKKTVEAIHASRANFAVAKAEERLAAIKAKVQELKNKGEDTDEIEIEIEEAEEDIDDAQESIGRKAFKESNEDLKRAYQKFRNIAEKAKGL